MAAERIIVLAISSIIPLYSNVSLISNSCDFFAHSEKSTKRYYIKVLLSPANKSVSHHGDFSTKRYYKKVLFSCPSAQKKRNGSNPTKGFSCLLFRVSENGFAKIKKRWIICIYIRFVESGPPLADQGCPVICKIPIFTQEKCVFLDSHVLHSHIQKNGIKKSE